jgi:para-nitrobenzyl esterase
MVGYWTQFGRAGDPNGGGLPQWPAYTSTGDQFLSLEPPTPVVKSGFAADHNCEFWDAAAG